MSATQRLVAAAWAGGLSITLGSGAVRAAPPPPTGAPAPVTSSPVVSQAPVERQHPPGHGMVVAGVAITLGSVAAYGLLGAGLSLGNRAESELPRLDDRPQIAERRDALRRGKLGNRLAIAGAITAVVAAGVGIPLIVIGRRRARAAVDRRVALGIAPHGVFLRIHL